MVAEDASPIWTEEQAIHKSPKGLDCCMVVPQSLIDCVSSINSINYNTLSQTVIPLPPIPLSFSSSSNPPLLKKKRIVYNPEQRERCLQILDSLNGELNDAVRHIRKTSGYEKIEAKTLTNWLKTRGAWKRVGGRKPPKEFDEDVKNLLIVEALVHLNSGETAPIVSNIAFSYNMIQQNGLKAKDTIRWKNNK